MLRLSPQRARQRALLAEPATGGWNGSAVGDAAPARRRVGHHPARELALLRVSLPRYYGEKVTFALLGLLFPGLLVARWACSASPCRW